MESISFSPITRSILARFNPHEFSQEEIVLRIAFHLSLDCDSVPVRLLAEPEQRPALGGSAAVSAARTGLVAGDARTEAAEGIADALGLARRAGHGMGGGGPRLKGASRARDVRSGSPLAGLPGHGLCSRQLPHGLGGHLAGVLRTAPGRDSAHRRASPARGSARARKRPVPLRSDDRPRRGRSRAVRILSALQGLLKYAITGGGAHPFRTLLEELRDVSKVHGEVLEGFGRMPQGIPIRFN